MELLAIHLENKSIAVRILQERISRIQYHKVHLVGNVILFLLVTCMMWWYLCNTLICIWTLDTEQPCVELQVLFRGCYEKS